MSPDTPAHAGCNPPACPKSAKICEDAPAIVGALIQGEGPGEEWARCHLTALFLHELRAPASIQSTAARQTEFLLNAAPAAQQRRAREKRLSNA
jgi:hypothetical protein